MSRVFQIVVHFPEGSPASKEAILIADSQDDAIKSVSARLDEEGMLVDPLSEAKPTIEANEMTADYLETMYLAATDPDSPFTKAGLKADLSVFPPAVLDVLCPQIEGGEKIRDHIQQLSSNLS